MTREEVIVEMGVGNSKLSAGIGTAKKELKAFKTDIETPGNAGAGSELFEHSWHKAFRDVKFLNGLFLVEIGIEAAKKWDELSKRFFETWLHNEEAVQGPLREMHEEKMRQLGEQRKLQLAMQAEAARAEKEITDAFNDVGAAREKERESHLSDTRKIEESQKRLLDITENVEESKRRGDTQSLFYAHLLTEQIKERMKLEELMQKQHDAQKPTAAPTPQGRAKNFISNPDNASDLERLNAINAQIIQDSKNVNRYNNQTTRGKLNADIRAREQLMRIMGPKLDQPAKMTEADFIKNLSTSIIEGLYQKPPLPVAFPEG